LKRLYIISGCNGAGKTTASYSVLPEILNCKEFINADEIAKGLSPFNVESVAFQAGRLMLKKINHLLLKDSNFAFETTLTTKSYKNFILKAKKEGFHVVLLFFWLRSPELAVKRVEIRVDEGGHNIPKDVIERRYNKGLNNFFSIFSPIVDEWMFIDNSGSPYEIIAESKNNDIQVSNKETWISLNKTYNYGK